MNASQTTYLYQCLLDTLKIAKLIGERPLHRNADGTSSIVIGDSDVEANTFRQTMYNIRNVEPIIKANSSELAKLLQIEYLNFLKFKAEEELKELRKI